MNVKIIKTDKIKIGVFENNWKRFYVVWCGLHQDINDLLWNVTLIKPTKYNKIQVENQSDYITKNRIGLTKAQVSKRVRELISASKYITFENINNGCT